MNLFRNENNFEFLGSMEEKKAFDERAKKFSELYEISENEDILRAISAIYLIKANKLVRSDFVNKILLELEVKKLKKFYRKEEFLLFTPKSR